MACGVVPLPQVNGAPFGTLLLRCQIGCLNARRLGPVRDSVSLIGHQSTICAKDQSTNIPPGRVFGGQVKPGLAGRINSGTESEANDQLG